MPAGLPVVIGVGNPLRGDDGAGLQAVERIRRIAGIEVLSHAGEGIDLLELWAGAQAVVIVDTLAPGAPGAQAGTIVRFDVSAEPLPAATRPRAGHSVGVADAIEAARALDRLPRHVVVLGVVGADFALGAPLSEPVRAALGPLADAALAEARRLRDQSMARR